MNISLLEQKSIRNMTRQEEEKRRNLKFLYDGFGG